MNDILDFSKLEAGKLALDERSIDVRELMKGVASGLEATAEINGIRVHVEVDSSVPETVIGDPLKISQVLTNLGGNAVKFTERGTVTLSVRAREVGPTSVRLRFAVTDTGVGIPQDRLSAIFEEFNQAAPAVSGQYGGTGLGLAICKRLLDLYGSKVHVESVLNQGSRFSFELSLQRRQAQEARSTPNELTDSGALRGLRVLVAQEAEDEALVLTRLLGRWGAAVERVDTGAKAVDRMREHDYDLVLMDVQLPELDGLEATRAIRRLSSATSKDVPIIALTPSVEVGQRKRLQAAGFTDCLGKPFQPDMLYRSVSVHASIYRSVR